MARVLTFSRTFPAYHPKAGQPTHFVEKFLRSWDAAHTMEQLMATPLIDASLIDMNIYESCAPKHHTIRAGSRWKVGDKFSPRVWSGRPYNSKQIVIAPDTEVVKEWKFEISKAHYHLNGFALNLEALKVVAQNDGLEVDDLEQWFAKSTGTFQIICWNESVNY